MLFPLYHMRARYGTLTTETSLARKITEKCNKMDPWKLHRLQKQVSNSEYSTSCNVLGTLQSLTLL